MPTKNVDQQTLIDNYFEYIKELRNGQEAAVDKLTGMWQEDGVFEFAGSPPVTGVFKGINAIHVLYKNRVKACGMPLTLEGVNPVAGKSFAREVALGAVVTHPDRSRAVAVSDKSAPGAAGKTQRVVVGWTTVIETDDKRGFEVNGSHAFTFTEGKISRLKVSVSPKPRVSQNLDLNSLAVKDIGRLALAAWAVV
jgi:hypothetical protein